MTDTKATEGDLVVWTEKGSLFWMAGIVTKVDKFGLALRAKLPTTLDGWRDYPVRPARKSVFGPRVSSASGLRNLEALVQSAPLFETLIQARDYFAPHRVTS